MSSIAIKVEFLAGTDFADAVSEAKDKALKWDVAFVAFDFNGIKCSISRNATQGEALRMLNENPRAKYITL